MEDEYEIIENKSSDNDDKNILSSDLAKDKRSDTAVPIAAVVIASEIGMHCWDELIG